MVSLLFVSSLLGAFTLVPSPAQALEFMASTEADLMGSGGNTALLEGVAIEDDMVKLATETYPIHDEAWSDSNANGMTVDNDAKPVLDFASHWTTYSGYDSTGVFGHSVCWDSSSSRVLLFGGAHDQGGGRWLVHNHLWSYNPGANTWTDLGGINRPKFFHTAVWAESEGIMIIWGGITIEDNQPRALNETIAYRPSTNQWFSMAGNPAGGRVYHTAVWDSANDQMLVVGGTPDGTMDNVTADLFSFRPSTNTWTRLASLPANQRRGGAAGFWDTQNDNFIIHGGQVGDNNPMTSVFSYKPSRNEWTQRPNAPIGRLFHSMGWDPIANRAYLYGGATGSGIAAQLYSYSPLQDSWRQQETAPDARYWTAFLWNPVHDVGYNFAGAATGGGTTTSYNDIMAFRTQVPYRSSGWLTSSIFDIGGILGVGSLSWTPVSQPTSLGDDPVRFQVASSTSIETPTNFVGPDGTPDSYYTNPTGTPVGNHHFGKSRIAYRMYFSTDDDTITPTLDTADMVVYRYANRGTYTSPVYDLDQPKSSFERITYRAEIPPDTNPNLVKVVVKIRTSSNPQMQGATAWEEILRDDTDIRIPYGRYFQFQVVITTDSQARHLTPLFKGITVKYNTPPTLTIPPSGYLDPVEGDRSTWFNYYVVYTDVDNDEPTKHHIYIDDVAFEMASDDTDYTNGAAFSYQTRHPLGDHNYYFVFSDGKNEVRDPPVGSYQGPTVYNLAPRAVIEYPAAATRFVPTEPVEFSAEGSSDPEKDPLSYTWTSSLQGRLSTEKAFLSILQEGVHLITLDVTDVHGANDSKAISILVKAYIPVMEIRDMYLDKTSPIEKDKVTVNAVVYNIGELEASPAVVEFLVDGVVVDSFEQSLDVEDRMVVTFTWTAEGDIVNLAVRARPGRLSDPDDETFREIVVKPNTLPTVKFDVTPLDVRVGRVVNFINNGTSDPDGDTLTYLWDFGDGTTATEATTQHVFTTKGTYFVNLTVTDKRGGVTKQSYPITVKPKESGSSDGISTSVLIVILVVVLAAAGIGGFMMIGRRKASRPAPPPPPSRVPRRPLPPPPPDWQPPAPEGEGGAYQSEGDEAYYPPEGDEAYYPPEGDEAYYPPEGDEAYYPPDR